MVACFTFRAVGLHGGVNGGIPVIHDRPEPEHTASEEPKRHGRHAPGPQNLPPPWRCAALALGLLGMLACGDDGGFTPDGAPPPCVTAEDCDDGVYCNGSEVCDPSSAAANADGCLPGADPCAGSECDEASGTCVEGTCQDRDGDGRQDAACGGDDCDDDDPDRYPGNVEVCDSAGHDEDCDPNTLGSDMDMDGYVDEACCNLRSDGALRCGADCDDASADINPESVDSCGGGDQDCDGDIDEEPDLVFYRDLDGDGYGVPDDTVMACGAPSGYALVATDCNDMVAAQNPGERELCDLEVGETPDPLLHDQDCDGAVDEGCGCTLGARRDCGSATAMTGVGRCRPGVQDCIDMPAGTEWGSCSSIEPRDELCNGEDDDCDGSADETFQCVRNTLATGATPCGTSGGTRQCGSDCSWEEPAFGRPEDAATCNYCDDTAGGVNQELPYATSDRMVAITASGRAIEGVAEEGADTYSLIRSDQPNAAGAITSPAFTMGHGTATITTSLRANRGTASNVGDGWALYLIEDSAPPYMGNIGRDLGAPLGKNGFAIEWVFYRRSDGSQTENTGYFRHLRTGLSDPIIDTAANLLPRLNGTVSTTVTQAVTVTITPDDMATAANETTVRAIVGSSGTLDCGPTSTPCPFRVTPGDRYRFGLSAGTGSWTASIWWSIFGGAPAIQLTDLCP